MMSMTMTKKSYKCSILRDGHLPSYSNIIGTSAYDAVSKFAEKLRKTEEVINDLHAHILESGFTEAVSLKVQIENQHTRAIKHFWISFQMISTTSVIREIK